MKDRDKVRHLMQKHMLAAEKIMLERERELKSNLQ
jgi:hypothetical protein